MKTTNDVLQGTGDEQILLLQAQGLALIVVIVGIEHLGQVLAATLLSTALM